MQVYGIFILKYGYSRHIIGLLSTNFADKVHYVPFNFGYLIGENFGKKKKIFTELFFSHIFNMKFHAYILLRFIIINGFADPKRFRDFRETGPSPGHRLAQHDHTSKQE